MADLSKKSVADLEKAIGEKRKELRSFRFGETGGKTRNVMGGRNLRRDIARIMTELSKRQNA